MILTPKEVILKNGSRATIRTPQKEDAALILAHMKQTAGETHFLLSYPDERNTTLEEEEIFLTRLAQSPRNLMLAAFIDNKLAGIASLNAIRGYGKTYHRASLAIALCQTAWGLGLGTALMQELIAAAPACGYTQLELDAFSQNTRALALYTRLGFTEYGRLPHAYRLRDGSDDDAVMMIKML